MNVFIRALEMYPEDAELNFKLGVTQQTLGKAQNAAQSFASTLRADPQVRANEKARSWL